MKRTKAIIDRSSASTRITARNDKNTATNNNNNKRTPRTLLADDVSSSSSVCHNNNTCTNKTFIMDTCLYLAILLVSFHILYQQHCVVVSGIVQQQQNHRPQQQQQQQQQTDSALLVTTTTMATADIVDDCIDKGGESSLSALKHTVQHSDDNKNNTTTTTTTTIHAEDSSSSSLSYVRSATGDHNKNNIVIDMISISSHSRPHYPVVQQASFGSHPAVRNFWIFTEDDDDDQQCHNNMTVQMVQQVANLCRRPSTYSKLPLMKRHFAPTKWLLERTKNPVGWLCAQKRPLTALHTVLQGYFNNNNNNNNSSNNDDDDAINRNHPIPDYLFVMDDDSWFHLEQMLPVLQQDYPPQQSHLIAGCLIRSPKDERFAFYWGGFGIILTKSVIQRLLVPLTCNDHHNHPDGTIDWSRHYLTEPALPLHNTWDFQSNQDFVQYACHKIALNLIGEQYFYQPNMSMMDLIYQYGLQQPYSQVDQWRTDATFCMHSDTTLTYFWQYYHVAGKYYYANDRDSKNTSSHVAVVDYDRIKGYRGSIKIRVSDKSVKPPIYESRGECAHISNDDCTTDSHLCHYVTATRMKELFREIQRHASPGLYQPTVAMPEIEFEDVIAKHPDAVKNRKVRQAKANTMEK